MGLQCLRKTGGWSEVQTLNKPLVLELWDEEADPYYGALVSIQDDRYTLTVGDQQYSVAPRDLRDSWFGAYVVLWQTPPDYSGSLREGDRHSAVPWLRERLAQIHNQTLPPGNDLFDQALTEAVARFQQSEGLQADGIAGPMTWIHLNRYFNDHSPQLTR